MLFSIAGLTLVKYAMEKFLPINLGNYADGVALMGAGAVGKVAHFGAGSTLLKAGVALTGAEAVNQFLLKPMVGGITGVGGGYDF